MDKTMTNMINTIIDFQAELGHMPEPEQTSKVTREQFTLLLSGISANRKSPGIPTPMGFDTLYHCDSKENAAFLAAHLNKMLERKDKASLQKVCHTMYAGCNEYQQFMTFWNKVPMFDESKLTPEGKEHFERCKEMANHFYPFVKEKGFYAWDINERIGLARLAVAANLITEEEFWEITDEWVRLAQVFYHSFKEYAMSCLCGAVYYMSRFGEDLESIEKFLELNLHIIQELLKEDGIWSKYQWYVPEEPEFAHLIVPNPGCIISQRAMEVGAVNVMFHEEPLKEHPDSGWRFFAGDETPAYRNNPENMKVVGLNTICNLQPDILAYIYAPVGKHFMKYGESWEEEE